MAPDRSKHQARSDEDEAERLDRELIEPLDELRVVMPGVQVMFGFQLTDVLFHSLTIACTSSLFAWLWFGLALRRRASGRTPW